MTVKCFVIRLSFPPFRLPLTHDKCSSFVRVSNRSSVDITIRVEGPSFYISTKQLEMGYKRYVQREFTGKYELLFPPQKTDTWTWDVHGEGKLNIYIPIQDTIMLEEATISTLVDDSKHGLSSYPSNSPDSECLSGTHFDTPDSSVKIQFDCVALRTSRKWHRTQDSPRLIHDSPPHKRSHDTPNKEGEGLCDQAVSDSKNTPLVSRIGQKITNKPSLVCNGTSCSDDSVLQFNNVSVGTSDNSGADSVTRQYGELELEQLVGLNGQTVIANNGECVPPNQFIATSKNAREENTEMLNSTNNVCDNFSHRNMANGCLESVNDGNTSSQQGMPEYSLHSSHQHGTMDNILQSLQPNSGHCSIIINGTELNRDIHVSYTKPLTNTDSYFLNKHNKMDDQKEQHPKVVTDDDDDTMDVFSLSTEFEYSSAPNNCHSDAITSAS